MIVTCKHVNVAASFQVHGGSQCQSTTTSISEDDWGGGGGKKESVRTGHCVILLMEEIRLTTWDI